VSIPRWIPLGVDQDAGTVQARSPSSLSHRQDGRVREEHPRCTLSVDVPVGFNREGGEHGYQFGQSARGGLFGADHHQFSSGGAGVDGQSVAS
jgi:hypothetical protein